MDAPVANKQLAALSAAMNEGAQKAAALISREARLMSEAVAKVNVKLPRI